MFMFIAYFGMAECVSQLSNPAITPTHLVSWIGLLTEVDNSKADFHKIHKTRAFHSVYLFLISSPHALGTSSPDPFPTLHYRLWNHT
jgi:hypothetical protein